jgi:site-specific DNA-methyltransferase (adenine-specific)
MDIIKIVKKISLLHSTDTETSTSYALAVELVNKLKIDWSRTDLKIADLCCGRGTFLLAIIDKLLEYGHTPKEIVSMIYGYDVNSVQAAIARKSIFLALGIDPHVYCDNSLEKIWNMKFDVIVGNPPFGESDKEGKRKSLSTNLWSKFLDKSVNELLVDGGHLAMITPASWAAPTKNLSGGRRMLKDIFCKNDTYYISLNNNISKHFNVASTFSYYLLKKAEYTGNTVVELDNSSLTIDLRDYDSLPRINNELAYSIGRKYASKISGEIIRGSLQSKKIIQYQEKADSNFTYSVYHTPAKGGRNWYTNVPHPNLNDHKVMISLSGNYRPVIDHGTMGFSDMCLAYIVKDGETVESAYSVINSKLFHFIMACNKWSGFNNKEIIRKFALPPLTKVYTDLEIYDYFGLNDAEKEFVEKFNDTTENN